MYNDVYSQYWSPEAIYTPEELFFLNQGDMGFNQSAGLLDTQQGDPLLFQTGDEVDYNAMALGGGDAGGSGINKNLLSAGLKMMMGSGQHKDDIKDPGVRMGQFHQFNFLGGPGPRQASFNPMAY